MFLCRLPDESVHWIFGRINRMIRFRRRISSRGKIDPEFEELLPGRLVSLRDRPDPGTSSIKFTSPFEPLRY